MQAAEYASAGNMSSLRDKNIQVTTKDSLYKILSVCEVHRSLTASQGGPNGGGVLQQATPAAGLGTEDLTP
jgi:hypothetical protein